MAFTVPTFNLAVDIWSGPWLTASLRISTMGNLAFGRRVQQQFQDFEVPQVEGASLQMGLLLPAGTDLHDGFQGFPSDVIEVPSGSGRWYGLVAYDDVGKGFSNEYRFALITKIAQNVDPVRYLGLFWPTPVP